MHNLSTRELFNQIKERLIIDLKENETVCPACKGMRFILIEEGSNSYIGQCGNCYDGKVYVCKHCGEGNKTSHCDCKGSREERELEFNKKQTQKEMEALEKAEKVSYKDYDGYYILEAGSKVNDIEDVEDWIRDKLEYGEIVPDYLWAVEGEPVFSIDLLDIIYNNCEDGYEEMYECLDTQSQLLHETQKLIDKWEEEQGGSLNSYYKTYKKAVIIKDLVDKIRNEIKS